MKISKLSSYTGQQMNVEKHYQNHTVQVFILVARLLDSVMRATTFLRTEQHPLILSTSFSY